MTLRKLAATITRPRGWCLAAAGLLAIAHLSGCSHHRSTTYRPIFARPTSGCSNLRRIEHHRHDRGPIGGPRTTSGPLALRSVERLQRHAKRLHPEGLGWASSTRRSSNRRARPGPEPEPEWNSIHPRRATAPSRSSPPAPPRPARVRPGPARSETNPDGTASTWKSTAPTPGCQRRRPERAARGGDRAARPGWSRISPARGANELFYPNKADRPWRYIVLHHSASASGNYDEIDREHRKLLGYDGCGYHFVIGNGNGSGDGQIEVAQRWNNQKQGVHCRNARSHDVDEYGIGICLIGDLDQQPPTPRQVAATQALVAYLSQHYHIDPDRVSTHAHLAATPTVCPGKYFPTTLRGAREARRTRGELRRPEVLASPLHRR